MVNYAAFDGVVDFVFGAAYKRSDGVTRLVYDVNLMFPKDSCQDFWNSWHVGDGDWWFMLWKYENAGPPSIRTIATQSQTSGDQFCHMTQPGHVTRRTYNSPEGRESDSPETSASQVNKKIPIRYLNFYSICQDGIQEQLLFTGSFLLASKNM